MNKYILEGVVVTVNNKQNRGRIYNQEVYINELKRLMFNFNPKFILKILYKSGGKWRFKRVEYLK